MMKQEPILSFQRCHREALQPLLFRVRRFTASLKGENPAPGPAPMGSICRFSAIQV